ncbi:MAG: hypothetical protein ACRBM6_06330 [Geminicoccales bacterium]
MSGTIWKSRQSSTAMKLIAKRSDPVQRPVALMIAFGLEGTALQQAIAQIKPIAPDDPTPVFLIDHADFSSLTRDSVLFEHFPSSVSKAMVEGDPPWQRYAERRLDLLIAKWRPVSIIPLGKGSQSLLSSWRARRKSVHDDNASDQRD